MIRDSQRFLQNGLKAAAFSLVMVVGVMNGDGAEPTRDFPGNPQRRRDPAAVKEVLAGKRKTANAAWWGFDENDATPALQAAIDSGAEKVVVSNVGADWIITPITLAANQEIVLEPGVVVTAKKGSFRGTHDSLFKAADKTNITFRGYGATLRMQKQDYMSAHYKKAEWRSALYFDGCSQVEVYGLVIRDTGGDGIYLGNAGEAGVNKNVVIRDVRFVNNYRQGISAISVENLLIENCSFRDTGGTGPAAGIDLESDYPPDRMVNVVIRNCVAENNQGPGFVVSPAKLSAKSKDISVLFEDCYVKSGRSHGFMVSGVKDDGPGGTIEFRNCHAENTRLHGARILDKSADRARVRFVNCTWKNVATGPLDAGGYAGVPNLPIMIHLRGVSWSNKPGGIDFVDCVVHDERSRPFLAFKAPFANAPAVSDIHGNVTVLDPHGAEADLGDDPVDVELRINR